VNYSIRIIILSILDSIMIALSVILAYFLRFDFQVKQPFFSLLPYVIGLHISLVIGFFFWVKIYKRVWRYASIGEVISLVKAITLAEIMFYAIHMTVQTSFPEFIVPRSIYILAWVLITATIGGSRFVWRMFRDSYFKIQPHHRRTLIVGAGKAGALIAKELKHSSSLDLYPIAFIDDDQSKWKLEILGLPVLGGREKISEVVAKHSIDKIIIAIPSASKAEIAKIIEICKETKAKIKLLPRVSDLVDGKISINLIREVSLEDLLGRDPVQVDLEGIANYVTNQVVLVTGAGGSIGSELCRQILPFAPKQLLLLGRGENSIYDIEIELKKNFPQAKLETVIADVKDRHRIKAIFSEYKPSVVFHAAAHKHVPLMEKNPGEAVKNNIIGTKNVAECAHEYGADRFVMVSTDKAVNPTSIMGATKRVAEMFVQGMAKISHAKFITVRFGNVLGSRGSVIPLFKRQIEEGGPVTVTHPEMIRYFMTIPEAAQLIIQAGALAKGGEIFILDMGQPVKILELAKDLIRLSGFEPDKDIKVLFTGVRPGEKLYEEILTQEEGISATKHNRIFVGKPSVFSLEELQFVIRKLEQIVLKKDDANFSDTIRDLIKQAVPTFVSINNRTAKEVHDIIRNELACTKEKNDD
jgi:FlaA1/EpsC-like NDP-sugar epimerase